LPSDHNCPSTHVTLYIPRILFLSAKSLPKYKFDFVSFCSAKQFFGERFVRCHFT